MGSPPVLIAAVLLHVPARRVRSLALGDGVARSSREALPGFVVRPYALEPHAADAYAGNARASVARTLPTPPGEHHRP